MRPRISVYSCHMSGGLNKARVTEQSGVYKVTAACKLLHCVVRSPHGSYPRKWKRWVSRHSTAIVMKRCNHCQRLRRATPARIRPNSANMTSNALTVDILHSPRRRGRGAGSHTAAAALRALYLSRILDVENCVEKASSAHAKACEEKKLQNLF